MVPAEDELDFAGPAVLSAGDDSYDVRVWLSGRVEPVDGRYHWGGRIAAHDGVAQLVRDGRRAVTLRTADGRGSAVPARLGEVDAWGGVGVRATGTPPWAGAAGPDSSDVDSPRTRDAIVCTDVAIVGAGFGGLGAAIRLKQQGHDDFLVFEQARGRGWHLAGQHVPRLCLRRALTPVLVLVRPQPGLVGHLLGAGRDLGVPAGDRGAVRGHAAPAPRPGAARRRLGHYERPVAGADLARGVLGPGPRRRDRPAESTVHTGHSRAADLRRHRVPLGPVAPRRRPRGRPGGGHRHRGLRDPVRTGDRADGRVADACSSAPRPGCCRAARAGSPASSTRCTGGCRARRR